MLRLAHEWKEIQRVPRIRLLRGERNRDFVLRPLEEGIYLAACPEPLCDIAAILLDSGLRLGELLSLEWMQVHVEPALGAKFGYVTVLSGKAKTAEEIQQKGGLWAKLRDVQQKLLTSRRLRTQHGYRFTTHGATEQLKLLCSENGTRRISVN